MPTSWGYVEDGEYTTIRETLSAIIAIFGLALGATMCEKIIAYEDEIIRNNIKIKNLNERLDALRLVAVSATGATLDRS